MLHRNKRKVVVAPAKGQGPEKGLRYGMDTSMEMEMFAAK